jgi:hypothetical protein
MREYAELSSPDKLRAVLATVFRPISKEHALDLAGLEPTELEAVNSVFSEEGVVEVDGKFWIPTDRQEAVITRLNVNVEEVHGVIGDALDFWRSESSGSDKQSE